MVRLAQWIGMQQVLENFYFSGQYILLVRLCVVTKDVPDNGVVVGVPGRVNWKYRLCPKTYVLVQ